MCDRKYLISAAAVCSHIYSTEMNVIYLMFQSVEMIVHLLITSTVISFSLSHSRSLIQLFFRF